MYCARVLAAVSLLWAAAVASAASQVVDAVVAEVNDRGFVLTVGGEAMVVEDQVATRFWKAKASAGRGVFKQGEEVRVRLKTDSAPTILREMADRPTFAWLEKVRKEPVLGTVKRVDPKYVTLALEDGSSFSYRATDKSTITIEGKKSSSSSLKEGQKVWAKGRVLPNLDTWLVSLSDRQIAAAAPSTKPKAASPKPNTLAKEGALVGTVSKHLPEYKMFDLQVEGKLMHVTYNAQTRFLQGGQTVSSKELRPSAKVTVSFKRDSYGRIIATKTELG